MNTSYERNGLIVVSKYTKRTWLTLALAGGLTFSAVAPLEASAEETSQEMIAEKEKIDAEVKALASELNKLQEELDAKVKVFEQVAADIKKVDADIEATTKRIEKRSELLGERMAAYQAKDSNMNVYFDAVFSASSISDLLDRVTAVKTLLDADEQLIEEQKADNEALKKQKKVLADKQAELQEQFRALQKQEGEIEVKKAENEAKSLKLKEQIATKQEEERLERERQEAERKAAELRALQEQEFAAQQAAVQPNAVQQPAAQAKAATTPTVEPPATSKPVASGVSGAIAEAHKYIGMPYNWGGASPATSFDCSGLTQYSYAKAGISLPRTAAQQYLATTRVAADQAQAGDLVFFSYGSGIQHVGIYLGGGMMINSQDSGVTVEPISGTWLNYLVGYGRP